MVKINKVTDGSSKDCTKEFLVQYENSDSFQFTYPTSASAKNLKIEYDDKSIVIDSSTLIVKKDAEYFKLLKDGLCDLYINYTKNCEFCAKNDICFVWNSCYKDVEFSHIFHGVHQRNITLKNNIVSVPRYAYNLESGIKKEILTENPHGFTIYTKHIQLPNTNLLFENINTYIAVHFRSYELNFSNVSFFEMLAAFKDIWSKDEKYLILTDCLEIKNYLKDKYRNCYFIEADVDYEKDPSRGGRQYIIRNKKSLDVAYTEIYHASKCKELYYTRGRFACVLINNFRENKDAKSLIKGNI
jgi:hypothetical protein